jgi:hypothetical protein
MLGWSGNSSPCLTPKSGRRCRAAVAGRLQPRGAVMARQAQDANARPCPGCGQLSRISAVILAVLGPMAAASARMRSIVQSA